MKEEKEIRKLAEDYIDSCTKKSGFVILAESLKGDFIDLFVAGFMKCLEVNKIDEWHFVKDEDLPKENKLYFVAIKDNGLAIAYFNGLHWETRYNLGDFGHCVETVIAWKEIVLPELKEIE
jgi:hypothetical protein